MGVTLGWYSFTGGEWAPGAWLRADMEKYYTAARTMRNALCLVHGGVCNRPGTRFVGAAKYADKKARLVSFEFSVEQAYALEFGDEYMRVVMDGGHVLESTVSITSTSALNPVKVTASTHGYATGDDVVISGVSGMTELNGRRFTITKVDADNFTLDGEDGSGYDAGTGGTAERVYTLPTPWDADEVWELDFSQSADTLFVSHPGFAQRKITRNDHDDWTVDTVTIGPTQAAPTSLNRSSGSGTTHNFVLTAVSELGEESNISNVQDADASDTLGWTAPTGDTPAYYRLYMDENKAAGLYYWLVDIEGSKTSYVLPSTLTVDLKDGAPEAKNPFNGADLYPAHMTFFDQRKILARSNDFPQTLYGSQVGFYDNFNQAFPLRDSDAWEFTLAARKMNEIVWMRELVDLVIATKGGEWRMRPGSDGDTITPTSVFNRRQSRWGAAPIAPLVVGNTILFLAYGAKRVRELAYSLESGYEGRELTVFSRHLFDAYGAVDWCYQREPFGVAWVVRADGVLCGLTYLREHDIWGWHRHDTDGEFESVCAVPAGGNRDDVYCAVKRTVNGQTKRYIEYFAERLPEGDVEQGCFVDSALTLDEPHDITDITATGDSLSDQFGASTAQNFTADGEAQYGWHVANIAKTQHAQVHNYTAGKFSVLHAASTSAWLMSYQTGPFFYWLLYGSFEAETRVTVAAGGAENDEAGILVQSVADVYDHLKLTLRKTATGYAVSLWSSADGSSQNLAQEDVSSGDVWLRVTRQGTTYTYEYSEDGSAWTTLHVHCRTDLLSVLRVGLVQACPSSSAGTYRVEFDYFGTDQSRVVVTSASHGLSNGDLVDIRDVEGMTDVNGVRYQVLEADTDTFTLGDYQDGSFIDGSDFGAYIEGGTWRTPVSTVTGLSHLEGATVAILANGAEMPQAVVSTRQVSLPAGQAASIITVGLPITSRVETQEMVYQGRTGTVAASRRRITSVQLEAVDTAGLWVGPDYDHLTQILFRDDELPGMPTQPYTGSKHTDIDASEEVRHSRVCLQSTAPLPWHVAALKPELEVGDV